jgi:hypothetical protein
MTDKAPIPDNKLIMTLGATLDKFKNCTLANVDQSHAYRYIQMVKTSTLGANCRYAIASLKLWDRGQRTEHMEELTTLRDCLNVVIELHELDLAKQETIHVEE